MIKSKRARWARHVARMGRRELYTWFFVYRHEGRLPLGISRHRGDDNIKMCLQEISSESMDWNDVAQ
jgi:hypothetical protein